MNLQRQFHSWLFNKMIQYLASKEGCIVTDLEQTEHTAQVNLQDVFGYRYEVKIKILNRVNLENEDFNAFETASNAYFSTSGDKKVNV